MEIVYESTSKLTKRDIVSYYIKNPNVSIDEISDRFRICKSTTHEIITKHFEEERQIYVVPSFIEPDTFFALNAIFERKFTVDKKYRIKEHYNFNKEERKYLSSIGFTVPV